MDYREMQASDYRWFLDHLEELYFQHGEAYVVIQNKKVIGVYGNESRAVLETRKKEPMGSFIVQLCGPNEESLVERAF